MAEVAQARPRSRAAVPRARRAPTCWLRDRAGVESRPGACSRACIACSARRCGPRHRRLEVRSGDRPRPLRPGLHAPQRATASPRRPARATIMRPGDRFTTSVGQPLPGVGDHASRRARETRRRPARRRRDPDPRPDRHARVLQAAGRDGGVDQGRLAAHRRPRPARRRRPALHHRPQEGDHRPRSGKNLYPEEIEAHYRQSPFIKELCVLGLSRPGEPAAERLHAVVVPDEQVLREKRHRQRRAS